jgi:hypothetical protein
MKQSALENGSRFYFAPSMAAYASRQNAAPQGQDRPRKRQELPIDFPAPLCQYRTMLGETRKLILPHPRSAHYMRVREKQIPIRYCLHAGMA